MAKRLTRECLSETGEGYNGLWVQVFGSDGQAREGGRMYVYLTYVVIYRPSRTILTLSPTSDDMWENEENGTKFALFIEK